MSYLVFSLVFRIQNYLRFTSFHRLTSLDTSFDSAVSDFIDTILFESDSNLNESLNQDEHKKVVNPLQMAKCEDLDISFESNDSIEIMNTVSEQESTMHTPVELKGTLYKYQI